MLGYQERKRFYRIKIHYEKEEFIKNEFELSYGDIEKKIKDSVISALLNYINRVKKKNELRAEIKRGDVVEKEDREEELQDDEENDDREKEDKDKLLKEFIESVKEDT